MSTHFYLLDIFVVLSSLLCSVLIHTSIVLVFIFLKCVLLTVVQQKKRCLKPHLTTKIKAITLQEKKNSSKNSLLPFL